LFGLNNKYIKVYISKYIQINMIFDINGIRIKTRKCSKSDLNFALKLTRETLFPFMSKYFKPSTEKFRKDFYESYKNTLILIKSKIRIGLFQIEKNRNNLEIVKILISPRYQGKGIGKYLMKYFETLGAKKIILQVWDNNPAFYFYKKLGYYYVKKIKHKIHMEKIIK